MGMVMMRAEKYELWPQDQVPKLVLPLLLIFFFLIATGHTLEYILWQINLMEGPEGAEKPKGEV